MRYCKWFLEQVTYEGEELDNWFWTDEAWFHLDGYVNSQNSRIWSTCNPHEVRQKQLHPRKIGVWCAVSRKRIFCTFFENTINSERYIAIVNKFVNTFSPEDLLKTWFQQDNATAHTSRLTIAYLESVFHGQIISKDLWPPRSPDLTVPDFFLWGHLKNSVYFNNPRTLDDLKLNIQQEIANITIQTLQRVFSNMIRRIHLCLQINGEHFQHYL